MDKKTDVRDPDEKVVEIEMERLRAFPNHTSWSLVVETSKRSRAIPDMHRRTWWQRYMAISLTRTGERMHRGWRMRFITGKILIRRWRVQMLVRQQTRWLFRKVWMRTFWWRFWEIRRWRRCWRVWRRAWKLNKNIIMEIEQSLLALGEIQMWVDFL